MGKFKDEIVLVEIKGCKGVIVFDIDEYLCMKKGVESYELVIDLDMFVGFKLVFCKGGSVMVGNVLGFNDGVVVLVLMSVEWVCVFGVKLLVCWVGGVVVGVEVWVMGLGFIFVICKLLECIGV